MLETFDAGFRPQQPLVRGFCQGVILPANNLIHPDFIKAVIALPNLNDTAEVCQHSVVWIDGRFGTERDDVRGVRHTEGCAVER